jgi:hypothetical protein
MLIGWHRGKQDSCSSSELMCEHACLISGPFMLMSVLTNGCPLNILCIVKSYCYIYITIEFDVTDVRSIAGTWGVSLSPS